ncbi:MAG: DUF885 domain-containing protein [bacterium]
MKKLLLATSALLVITACDNGASTTETTLSTTSDQSSPLSMAELDQQLVTFLDQAWEKRVALSPEYQTYLGRKTNYDVWDDYSDAAANKRLELIKSQLATLEAEYPRDQLSDEGKLNYDLFKYTTEEEIGLSKFRMHRFAFSQFRGAHSFIPVMLANYHNVASKDDLEAYLSRVSKIGTVLDQNASLMEERAAAGYHLPEFSYPLIVDSATNVITGGPFDDGDASPILADFKRKLDALDADDAYKEAKLEDLKNILIEKVKPAYLDFNARVRAIGDTVQGNYGVGTASGNKDGDAYYAALLNSYTSSNMTPEEVHELGLAEVARIQSEMKAIMAQVGFEGSLQEFFEFMRVDPQFYYDNTDEDREKYLDDARRYIAGMEAKLDELFITKPKAPVEVRRVEAFRERAAGKAFYNQPAQDGSRPGIFYANLLDMKQMPKYQLEALVYHEAIPGHHMQRSIQIEMQDLPKFRQYGGYTAYTEGWGLYSEYLGKDVGLYEDPYSDFGRLAMELWRAARLVVDTGLHNKGWEMQEAIDYLTENTPNPEGDCVKAIERYIVFPGQATAYKVGMLKILELRKKASDTLGDKFNIADFHEVVLTGGPMPLALLEMRVDEYIAQKMAE